MSALSQSPPRSIPWSSYATGTFSHSTNAVIGRPATALLLSCDSHSFRGLKAARSAVLTIHKLKAYLRPDRSSQSLGSAGILRRLLCAGMYCCGCYEAIPAWFQDAAVRKIHPDTPGRSYRFGSRGTSATSWLHIR
jgi:hypothetical protein